MFPVTIVRVARRHRRTAHELSRSNQNIKAPQVAQQQALGMLRVGHGRPYDSFTYTRGF